MPHTVSSVVGEGQKRTIDYITFSTTGNATDFGDNIAQITQQAGASDGTYGIFGGGSAVTNTIESITIAMTGNSSDFGDLTVARQALSAVGNDTYGVFGGGLVVVATITMF